MGNWSTLPINWIYLGNPMRDHMEEPGSYALQLSQVEPISIEIGQLGSFTFPPGLHIYCGSALGRGGVRGRTKRYFKEICKPHWHIDHLLPSTRVEKILYINSSSPMECIWSQALASLPHAQLPAHGFGSSDCKSGCKSHLVLLPYHEGEYLIQHLQKFSGSERIKIWQGWE